jgi:hypothetical protein
VRSRSRTDEGLDPAGSRAALLTLARAVSTRRASTIAFTAGSTIEVVLPAMPSRREWQIYKPPYPAGPVKLIASTLKPPRLERCLLRVLGRPAPWPHALQLAAFTLSLQLAL